MLEGHGDDIYKYGTKIEYNFSSNIYQGFNHENLRKYLLDNESLFSRYPEPSPKSLERLIAQKNGLREENIIITAGSTDSIYQIGELYRGRNSMIITPTFAEYQDACLKYNHSISFVKENDLKIGLTTNCDVVWICNPNNPTGKVIDPDTLESIIENNRQSLFVVDMAYEDYTLENLPDWIEWSEKENVIILHSLTKRFGIPGLRIGFVSGNQRLISKLKNQRIPWKIAAPSLEACRYLINNSNDYVIPINKLIREAFSMRKTFEELGLQVIDSRTNFFSSILPKDSGAILKDFLVFEKGILIRDASNFKGYTKRHIRVAAQGNYENNLLVDGIKEWLSL